jgi:hypothetical protein
VQVLPTWAAIGLRASASHAFEIHDLVVPDTHAFDIDPAAATQPGALYRFPFDALAYVTLAASLGGMARGFLRLATPLVLERPVGPSRQPLGTRLQVRAQLQSSVQQLDGPRGWCLELLDEAWSRLERDGCSVDEKPLHDARWPGLVRCVRPWTASIPCAARPAPIRAPPPTERRATYTQTR